jgi:DNA-binding MarR family transcriptional regulator
MADIIFMPRPPHPSPSSSSPVATSAPPASEQEQEQEPEPDYALIELLFFAYRDFVADADQVLVGYGFGRAHHRVLHFVDRNPGLRVRDLLEILKITKQSLARVLKALIDGGFIRREAGASDRREKRLFTTEKGHALARRLAFLQSARIARAVAAVGPDAAGTARAFLLAMVDPHEREAIAARIGIGSGEGGR